MEANIFNAASELGKLVAGTDILTEYVRTKKAYDEDSDLINTIREYNVQQTAMDKLTEDDGADETLVNQIRARIAELYEKASQNENLIAYDNAENALNGLLTKINTLIREEIYVAYPEMRPAQTSCSGHCDSCGGCH